MRKMYMDPEMKINKFAQENVVAASGVKVTEPNDIKSVLNGNSDSAKKVISYTELTF